MAMSSVLRRAALSSWTRLSTTYALKAQTCPAHIRTPQLCSIRGLRTPRAHPQPMADEDGDSSAYAAAARLVASEPLASEAEISEQDRQRTKEIVSLVDAQIASSSHGRLFAIIYVNGRQRRVTDGDLVMFNYDMGLDIGEKICLDKVVLVGSRDFTLIGRPILPSDLARVEATVVEKNLEKTAVSFTHHGKPTRGKTNFQRRQQTTLRITRVGLECGINECKDLSGYETRNDSPIFK